MESVVNTGVEQASPDNVSADELMQARLAFAERCFTNVQDLNRSMDNKANFMLASVGLLTGSVGLLASGAISGRITSDWPGLLRASSIALILVYLMVAFSVVYTATSVYRASTGTLRPDTLAPGLLFPLMLLARYKTGGRGDEDLYLDRLMNADASTLLHDYANQILENSNIYEAKQSQVNLSLKRFRWLSVLWVATMLTIVASAVVGALS